MKSEQEFLNGMWYKVSLLESEEAEKMRIKSLNRKLTIKVVSTIIMCVVIFTLLIVFSKNLSNDIYPIIFGISFAAFIYESYLNKYMEGKKVCK